MPYKYQNKPVALITGTSSGFGRETARVLVQRGWCVFGASRRPSQGHSDNYRRLILDVRDDNSVNNCFQQVITEAGRIDLLVNNAGFLINGFAEEVSMEQVKDIFDTNFLGAVRMTKSVLPVMRRQKRGRIINISSVLGCLAIPYRSYYAATKFALEGFSEALNLELARFNIQVVLVKPGFFRTSLDDSMIKADQKIADYDKLRPKLDKRFQRFRNSGAHPRKVASLIADIAQAQSPRFGYRIGPYSNWLRWAKSLTPEKIYAYAIRRQFHMLK